MAGVAAIDVDLYANVATILDGGKVAPPAPTIGLRDDGVGLFYRGQENQIIGDPESAKTLMAQCAMVDELNHGGSALIIDIDHNGAAATLSRLISMGADDAILRNPDKFRYAAPDDADELLAIVKDTVAWQPTFTLFDSIGEGLPLFGASSNSPDDYTSFHTRVLKPIAASGSALVTIDHLAKNTDSQNYGATGTAAKKRAVGGTMLRSTVLEKFRPGHGGRAQITIVKDRHGGLRAASPIDGREPLATVFEVWDDASGDMRWRFKTPEGGERPPVAIVNPADIDKLSQLIPPPHSQRDVKERMGWGSARSLDVLRAWRELNSPTTVLPLPAPETPLSGAQEQPF